MQEQPIKHKYLTRTGTRDSEFDVITTSIVTDNRAYVFWYPDSSRSYLFSFQDSLRSVQHTSADAFVECLQVHIQNSLLCSFNCQESLLRQSLELQL